MKRKQCQSIAKTTGVQCEKRALMGGSYCWIHTPKKDPFIFLLIGSFLGFGIQAVYENTTTSPEEFLINDLKHQIEVYQDSIESKDERIDELEKMTALAKQELHNIKVKDAPWEFTEKQETKLRGLLNNSKKGKIEIAYLQSDGERAGAFAQKLEKIFIETGYDMAPEISMVSNTTNPTGINIKYRKLEDRERSKQYAQIFQMVGLPCKFGKIGDKHIDLWRGLENAVTVTVYRKP